MDSRSAGGAEEEPAAGASGVYVLHAISIRVRMLRA
jgi:hypothetical protein